MRAWFRKNGARDREVWVGFRKKGTGRASVTWPESVDEALCWGWIDGVRKSIDETAYKIRFTPRKPKSYWSEVNVKRAEALIAEGRMTPAGLAAFEARDPGRTAEYSFEARHRGLSAADEKAFRKNRAAWTFFEAQPPGYRKLASWWVVSAKKDETRSRRLATLVADSEAGRRLAGLVRPAKRSKG